ncbi:CRISPR-associated CARF protein Csa3 [Acidianus brierleyi]|uniref:Uncharacterized protein n=1 Tax=Acidianus brierleyi TaxID=41673 RepID=A0A2U9IGV9_9CREN|nr:CRISPR-associated CARF protein Csa3 [Acidianus brierleyi]AWR95239.1 CRISPR locus-related DNA-binding protein [Acidianus brierleyi]
MKTYLFSLGFHEDFMIRRLHNTFADKSDNILLVAPKPIAGASLRAYQGIQSYCSKLFLKEPNLLEIELTDFFDIVKNISTEILQYPEPFIVDVSGGMRLIGFAIVVSTLAVNKKAKFFITQEGDNFEIFFENLELKSLISNISKEKMAILLNIYRNQGITIDELANVMNRSRKTLINHLIELKEAGIVFQKGKNGGYYLSKLGEIICYRQSQVLNIK